jgi:putative hydrolase
MSEPGPLDPGNDPFKAMGPLGDMFRLVFQQAPANSWEIARQLAVSVATDGQPETNVDPLDRIQLEQLARVAELQVANTTGLPISTSGRGITIVPVNRGEWVLRSTPAYRELLEVLAGSLGQSMPMGVETGAGLDDPDDPDASDPFAQMLAPLMQSLRPMMMGVTAGSMLGHLARRSFGQYDLPVPRPPTDELLVVVPNVDEFGDEWSLRKEDLRLWVCIHEVAHHAVLNVPHVRERLSRLLREYASSFQPDPSALESKLGRLDLGDPSSLDELQHVFGDPEVLLGAIQSPAQREILPQLEALVCTIEGYVDHVMDTIGQGLVGSYDMLTEAVRRRRVTTDRSDRFVERLLGLDLDQSRYERGAGFIAGIVERAGPAGLERLWRSERELPTPAEVDAPGLWLARIDLPSEG